MLKFYKVLVTSNNRRTSNPDFHGDVHYGDRMVSGTQPKVRKYPCSHTENRIQVRYPYMKKRAQEIAF